VHDRHALPEDAVGRLQGGHDPVRVDGEVVGLSLRAGEEVNGDGLNGQGVLRAEVT
jgi:hypothetical protein